MLNIFFKFRFILVLACLKNYKRHDAKFCSVKCFERVHVLQMSTVHVLQMSPGPCFTNESSPALSQLISISLFLEGEGGWELAKQ